MSGLPSGCADTLSSPHHEVELLRNREHYASTSLTSHAFGRKIQSHHYSDAKLHVDLDQPCNQKTAVPMSGLHPCKELRRHLCGFLKRAEMAAAFDHRKVAAGDALVDLSCQIRRCQAVAIANDDECRAGDVA